MATNGLNIIKGTSPKVSLIEICLRSPHYEAVRLQNFQRKVQVFEIASLQTPTGHSGLVRIRLCGSELQNHSQYCSFIGVAMSDKPFANGLHGSNKTKVAGSFVFKPGIQKQNVHFKAHFDCWHCGLRILCVYFTTIQMEILESAKYSG